MEGFNNASSYQNNTAPANPSVNNPAVNNPAANNPAANNPAALNPAQKYNFQGIPGCHKCNGTGYKVSKKGDGKQKLCSACLEVKGVCPKCNGTGMKIDKPGKVCKCKEKASKKADKKSSKDKNN